MLASNGSVGPSSNAGGNTTTLLTVNGIIPNQQMPGQHGNRPSPVFTPFFPNATFTTFQSPFSGPTSVVPCIASPNGGTIFQGPGGQFPFNMTGSMLLTQPQSIINGTPISYQPFNHPVSVTNSSNGTTVVLTANDMCISSSGQLPIFQNGAVVSIASSNNTQTTNVSMNNSNSNNTTGNNINCVADSTAPSIKCKPEVKPVVPLGTVTNSNSSPESNLATLEKAQFYRDFILEAIDKLRDRKARPDMERISCLLRRQHNIQPPDTQLCLTRLAETGSILCVDYKGNLSYRNPAKWRKTAASAVGIANKPNISKRLIEAVRSLIPEGGDKSQSFTLFQIEQAIKNQKPPQNPEGEGESSTSTNILPPELTGSGLKISLDKEVNYGGLAKLHDGRYVLDEHGEKKHRSIMFNFNRRPFSGKLAANGTFGKPPIAPALDSVGGKPYNVFSLTPGRPLSRRPPISTGKRGRPPSIKNKKMLTSCSQQPILPAPSDNMLEKASARIFRMKLESVPVTPSQATTFVPIDGAMMVSATPMQTLSLTPAQQVTSQASVSGGPNAAPTAAMMMYPGIYNHPTTTLFAVTPETTSLVGSTFQPADAAGATLPVTLNTSNTVVTNSAAPTGSIVVVRPTANLATTAVTTPVKEGLKPVVAITTIKPSPSEESSQNPGPLTNEDICCRCQQKAGVDDFLTCQDCGIKDESFGGEDLESCFERDGVVITSICRENKIGSNSAKEPRCVETVSTFQSSPAVSLSLKLEVGNCQGQTELKDSLSVMRSRSLSVQRPPYVVQSSKPQIFKERVDNLDDYYSPESSPIEEYMWDSNFFGHSSVSQLTYTLVYLLGKILCIKSGVELFKLNMWDSLKFTQIRKAKKSVYDFDLFFSSPTGFNKTLKERIENKAFFIVLDHVLMCKDSGLLIKHSLKNNHQKCLVCYHALLLQKRNMLKRTKWSENYFLSWTNSSPSAVLLPEPLNEVALDFVIHDIQVVLTSLKIHLLRSSCPMETNLWDMFIKGQRPKELIQKPHPKAPGKLIADIAPYYLPLDLSVQRSAHPKCLDFSPETTATARENSWQCANCKSCSVCKVKKPENAMLICDACDKGYHDTCHNPAVTDRKNVDQTAPWICSSCQDLGYHVKRDETKVERQEIDSVSPPGSIDLPSNVALTSVAVSKVDDTQITSDRTRVVKSPPAEAVSCTDRTLEESHSEKSEIKNSPSKEASTNTVQNQEQMEVDDTLLPNEDTPQHNIIETQITNSRPENVRHWTASQVADWLKEQGNYEREADIFRENEIDGCALMLLKNYNLLIDTKIKIGPAVKILEKVRILQASMESRGL